MIGFSHGFCFGLSNHIELGYIFVYSSEKLPTLIIIIIIILCAECMLDLLITHIFRLIVLVAI